MQAPLQQLPNLLTAARICLTPLLYLAIAQSRYEFALIFCIVAGLSDALDGFLARRFQWTSRVGGYLDPIADKAMLGATYIAFAVNGILPVWFVAVLFARDLLILGGTAVLMAFAGFKSFPPTIWGKLSTICQIYLALHLIALHAGAFPTAIAQPMVQPLIGIVAVLTVASGVQYYVLNYKRWRAGTGA